MAVEIKFEKLADLLADDLGSMLAANYEAMETDADIWPLDVDWDSAKAQERLGGLRAIGVRIGGGLVGYSAFIVQRSFHSMRRTCAYNDVIWIEPQSRARCGAALVRRSEELLRGLGVERVFYSTKPYFPKTGDLLAALGYSVFETTWAKNL